MKAMKFSQIILRAGLLMSLAGAGLMSSCSKSGAEAANAGAFPAMPVKVLEAKASPVQDATEYVATLKSRDSAVIMPQVEGQITKIFVHSGDHVTAGTALLEIDPLKQQATVRSQEGGRAAQEASLQLQKQQFERAQNLYAAGVVSKQDLDQAKANLDSAQAQLTALDAQLKEQEVQLHYYKVTAPWAGIVGDVPVRVGDRVTVSTQLTTVDKPGSLEVYLYIPIERAPDLKMNLPVEILDADGKVASRSKINFISPQVDPSTQSVLAKAPVANAKDLLRQSEFVRARVVWGTHQNPLVPVLAVSRLAGQYFVFVAEAGNGGYQAKQHPLKVGQTVGNDYEVQDGIKPGDKVIVSGTQFLIDGAPVVPQT